MNNKELNTCAVVLAAGEGTRMKSKKSKVMTEVLFKPMIDWVLDSLDEAGVSEQVVIIGHKGEEISNHLGDRCATAIQEERLGTGHAVMQAVSILEKSDAEHIIILNGDAPLMDSETILKSLELHKAERNAVTVISANLSNPFGYGRIVRLSDGTVARIVEEKDADKDIKSINEVNSGAYWFEKEALLSALKGLGTDNEAGEYYLTDTLEVLRNAGKRVGAFATENSNVVLGANNRVQLLELNTLARMDVLVSHMEKGVDIPCTDGILIGKDVKIGRDTQILPNTIIKGNTEIGEDCIIGPNTVITDSVIKEGVVLNNVDFEESIIEQGADIGPFSHIRPGSHLGEKVHVGNFVEVKNSNVGNGTKIPHLTYVGDSDVGEGVNFGCGSLTVNYDGKHKTRTTVKDHAFIGCNTNLIAPVTVGEYAFTAAGSTITDDIPGFALSVARARQINKEGWVTRKKPYKNMK